MNFLKKNPDPDSDPDNYRDYRDKNANEAFVSKTTAIKRGMKTQCLNGVEYYFLLEGYYNQGYGYNQGGIASLNVDPQYSMLKQSNDFMGGF